MMLTMKENQLYWDGTKLAWTLVCGIVAAGYNGLLSYAQGGSGYEMLVSGNMKRRSETEESHGYVISKHKYVKEYRVWKGFAIGAFTMIYTVITGVIFGANQQTIDSQVSNGFSFLSVAVLFGFLLAGWSILPFFYMNASGIAVSYYYSCLFALLPIVAMGVMYIVGAYARRAKTLKRLEAEAAAQKAREERKKKINYGGLPGTKPRKRK